jgi:U3 small nucleolar RNA-associated protein 3
MVREGQKRKINYAIKKNKGLAKKAKKENRNSRVKLRNKYAKALTRRTGQVAGVRDQKKPYGGEVGGIKTNVVRSTKLVA